MSTRRRNPKKNPAARRPRGGGARGLPRARFSLEDVGRLLLPARADVLPLLALPAVWLWNMAMDGYAAAHCVDCCMTVGYALAEYGLASEIQAVGVGVAAVDAEPELFGLSPHYNQDGSFNGHTILLVPAAGRLLDPTVQQFAAVPRTVQAALPVMGRLPAPGGLGRKPFAVDRTDHVVMYVPLPPPDCDAWQQSQALREHVAEYQQAGANLAANVFDIMRGEGFRDRTAESPYPRLRTLLAALDGMTTVADGRGYRFADPDTGQEYRLADIPDPVPRASFLGRLRSLRR